MPNKSDSNEAVAIANALKPIVKSWVDEWERNCVRSKRMTVIEPYDDGIIGVREAFSSQTQYIPAVQDLSSVVAGDTVWVVWQYSNQATMVALWKGDIV